MNLLTELNESCTTVIMVTHSPIDAEYAHRVIHLFDGQIVSENINSKDNALV
ncbi:MAG: ABC transporter ATP-binding protein, partial [Bacteroidota bacterium]